MANFDAPVAEVQPPVDVQEEEDPMSGEEDDDDEEEEEEEGSDGDSDDECEDYDDSKPPEDQLLHYTYSAIKVVHCDFLGEFGAAEVFMIDGDALVAKALTDPLLDPTCGGQMMHLVYVVESILQDLLQSCSRGGEEESGRHVL